MRAVTLHEPRTASAQQRPIGRNGAAEFHRIEPLVQAYSVTYPHRRPPALAPNIDRGTASRLASTWGAVRIRLGYGGLSAREPVTA